MHIYLHIHVIYRYIQYTWCAYEYIQYTQCAHEHIYIYIYMYMHVFTYGEKWRQGRDTVYLHSIILIL